MKSETPLDYAVFKLSPKRSRCELFVSCDGNTEKLASGLMKPFATHLKIAEEQVATAAQSIKLETDRRNNGELWFTKGTLERFVRFVSTPEVLELVNTFDAEMSQLEAARTIYSQGVEDQLAITPGGAGSSTTTAADATKKELLRAIDVRLTAVKQDLTKACLRAAAAGFNPDTASELVMFADQFGAYRLNEACTKFITLYERWPDLIGSWKSGGDDRTVRASYGSDMSIDEESSSEQPSRAHQTLTSSTVQERNSSPQKELSNPSPWQQYSSTRESSIEKDEPNSSTVKKEEIDRCEAHEPPASQSGPPVRRLSVQDRISLFENKQKETTSGSGGKLIVAKSAELRRLPSDVSSGSAATDKAVLRRWSGVSDMSISIDLTGEKREGDSPLCTPSQSSASHVKSNDHNGLNDNHSSDKSELRSTSFRVGDPLKDQAVSSVREEVGTSNINTNLEVQIKVSAGRSNNALESDKSASTSRTIGAQVSTHSSPSSTQDQAASQSEFRSVNFDMTMSKGSYGDDELGGITKQIDSEMQLDKLKQGGGLLVKPGSLSGKSGTGVTFVNESYQIPGAEHLGQWEEFELKNQIVPQSRLRAPLKMTVDSGQLDSNSGSKIREAFVVQHNRTGGVLLDSESSWKSFGGLEEAGKHELATLEKHPESSIRKVEYSGIPRMKYQKQVSSRENIKKSQSRRNETTSDYGSNSALFSGNMVNAEQEVFSSSPVTPSEQVQRTRQSKGNQELNDELKMKANELEKLFAEHKLRAPGDQSNSARRSKPTEMQFEMASSLPGRRQVVDTPQFPDNIPLADSSGSSNKVEKVDASSLEKLVDSQGYGDRDTLKRNNSDLGFLDDSRGKFYDTYMQKRDAKLKEEWDSRRMEKEAKLKAMKDSFERSTTEMRAKFSGSADRKDSVFSARRHAERLRSFNTRTAIKMEQIEDDEDFVQEVSRSSQTKRLLPNRNLSSSMPRTSAAPVLRSGTKASNSSSVRRKMQSENPLVQSVPNFSDLRKEITKPYSAVSKIARPQLRNYTRSSNEEIPNAKEDKAWRSQSLRKNAASPAGLKDTSSFNANDVLLPLTFETEQTDQSRHDKLPRSMETRPSLQKNNSIGSGAGTDDVKLKSSVVSDTWNNDEESDDFNFVPENSGDVNKDEDEEGFLARIAEDHANRGQTLSQESVRVINSGSENGESLQSFSQVDPSSLPSLTTSTFHPVESVQDSPGESPMSWNSRIHHPFSYNHEVSDLDASADSPMGSPAAWNLRSLNQTEADVARMRKKWGSAQKPIIGSNSLNNQSRKDVTKGFKRLLKFGRKSRGTESLVDWISATTSEGDDDMEDGRDPANRSSEDLRKSRMGFSQGHASEDSLNESDFFTEQVHSLSSSIPAPPANFKSREDHLSGSSLKAPRSFFSLSSFRSKGNESKLR